MAFDRVSVDITFGVVGAHTQNGSLGSAVSITVPAGAAQMMLQAQAANVRFTLDGTAPTSTVGFLLVADDPPLVIGVKPAQVVKVIQTGAGAKLDYQFGS